METPLRGSFLRLFIGNRANLVWKLGIREAFD